MFLHPSDWKLLSAADVVVVIIVVIVDVVIICGRKKFFFLASKEKKSRLLRKKFRRIVQRKKPFLVRSDSFQFCLFIFCVLRLESFLRSILATLMLILNQEVIFPVSFYECADPENCQEWQILAEKMEVEGIEPWILWFSWPLDQHQG